MNTHAMIFALVSVIVAAVAQECALRKRLREERKKK